MPGAMFGVVLVRLPAVLLADVQRSVTAVDVTNPDKPVVATSLASNLGGVPVDIAAFGNIAMTADVTFGRAGPDHRHCKSAESGQRSRSGRC